MKTKRILSWLLVMIMAFTMTPISSFADSVNKVSAEKKLVSFDEKTGDAVVELNVSGKGKQTNLGADVILAVDESGSMGPDEGGTIVTGTCTSTEYRWVGFIVGHFECKNGHNVGSSRPAKGKVCGHNLTSTRMELAKTASKNFVNRVIGENKKNSIAIIGFDNDVSHEINFTSNINDLSKTIDKLYARNTTNYKDALNKAIQFANGRRDKSRPLYVIMMSDGKPNSNRVNGKEQAEILKGSGYNATIYTVGIALNNEDSKPLKALASIKDGNPLYNNVSANNMESDLNSVLDSIAGKIQITPAGRNTVMTDYINIKEFEWLGFVGDSKGAEYDDKTGKISWDIGSTTETGSSIKFKVKLKDEYLKKGGTYNTNTGVSVTYKDTENKNVTIPKEQIGDPTVAAKVNQKFTVNASIDNGGTINGNASLYFQEFVNGTNSETLTFKPAANYYIAGVIVNGASDKNFTPDEYTYTGRKVTGNVNITVTTTKKATFTVNYKAGTGTGKMDSETAFAGTKIIVKDNKFTPPENCVFNGWKDEKGQNVEVGSSLTENTVLTAQWRELEQVPDVKAEGYEGIYDGLSHGITVTVQDGAKVEYKSDGTDWTETNPKYTNATEGKTVAYRVSKKGYKTVEGTKDVKISKKPITVESGSLNKVYDGNLLTATIATVKELANADKGKITATATGTITEVGETQNTVVLNDDLGLLKNYTVSEQLGTLRITAREASIIVKNVSKKYGETDPEFKGEVEGLVKEGDLGTVTYIRTNKDVNAVGKYEGVLTANYAENKNYTVTVKKADFEIQALDMSGLVKATGYEGIYDGAAHGITMERPEGTEVIFKGDNGNVYSNAGKYIVDYTVKKLGYNDVTGSAIVNITKRPVTLKAGSASKTYDGVALTTTGYAISAGAIVTGQSIAVTVTGSQIQVGTTASAISAVVIKTPEGTDVTSNYEITKLEGVLTVNSKSSGGGKHHPTKPTEPTVIKDEEVPLAGNLQLNKTDHFNYVKGYQDGNVKPLDNITREEVATIFYRLLTEPSRAMYYTQSENFSDIASGRWSLNAIATLANGKVLAGYENGTFGAARPITRAEFAAIASRFDTLQETTDNQFGDVSNHWAKSYINSAAKKGWINGYEDGTFKPDQYITRAEAMTLINKVLERRVDATGLVNGYKVFPDNKENAWYYYQVIEATNNHKYAERKNMSDMEKWTEILSDKTWNE